MNGSDDVATDDGVVPTSGRLYRSAAGLAFGIFAVQRWQFDIHGLEHVPAQGGAVIASNHTSFWDFFTVGKGPYHELGRPVRILAKESLFRTPVFGRIMQRAEHIPVHRGQGNDALRSAVEALQRGELVLVLPEQTISRSFELLPFKTGAARMAALAGVPLVPAASWGSHRFHTVGRRPTWSWRLPVSVRFGEPLRPTRQEDPVAATAALRARVEELVHTAQASYPERPRGADDWWLPARLGGSAPHHDHAMAELDELRSQWRRRRGNAA